MSSEGEETTSQLTSGGADVDLKELLESALKDFEKPANPTSDIAKVPEGSGNAQIDSKTDNEDGAAESVWQDEFFLEAQKSFKENLKALLVPEDGKEPLTEEQLSQHLQNVADETEKLLTEHANSGGPNADFSSTIAETLRSLSANVEDVDAGANLDLNGMLQGLSLGGSETGIPDLVPFMQNVMQSLLSKEILYPSLKDIIEKYSVWLEENQSKLSESELDNYTKQYRFMKEVVTEYELETPTDSEEVKKTRYMKILALMDQMQQLGSPPQEIVLDGNPFPNIGNPSDVNQCPLM